MAADLNQLIPEFKATVVELISLCKQRGVEMRPYFTIRDPFEQARLWRQSRSTEEIQQKISEFERDGAEFLAHCLRSVGPQYGDHVTDSPPGFSWHQWGEALDCFWVVDGRAEWSAKKTINGLNGYRVYADIAKELQLTPGGFWTSLKDWPHVQLRAISNPGKVMSLVDINAKMKARFGG
jgi:peptidoglycan L-alanyl-D-glutamate endopeptidase CwlK